MAAERMSKKELKQPDAFQRVGGNAGAWLSENQKRIAAAVVLTLVIGLGLGLASYASTRGEGRASRDLGEALSTLARPVDATGAPGKDERPPFKSDKEKDEAVVKALTEFKEKSPDARADATASLVVAEANLRLGNADAALKEFDEFLKHVPADDPLRATGLEGRGYALEAKGELDQAMAAFDQLARENKTEFLNGMGLYHRARILIRQGKKEDAAKELTQIPVAAPGSAAARLAADRISLLAAEGVKLPPPPVPAKADAGTP